MQTIALVALVGLMNIVCLALGARMGQKISQGQPVIPSVHPLDAYQNRQQQKKARQDQEKVQRIMENIDRYDGTGMGQQDVEEVH